MVSSPTIILIKLNTDLPYNLEHPFLVKDHRETLTFVPGDIYLGDIFKNVLNSKETNKKYSLTVKWIKYI